jgi:pyrimidine deaminase RibD-like protein
MRWSSSACRFFFAAFYFLGANPCPRPKRLGWGLAAGVALALALFLARDFEGLLLRQEKNMVVRRDYAASVISFGKGLDKQLLVNGIGMTKLTPITKFMVHLPLAFHQGRPESALIICFGMGTSYRSALSWDIDTTAVELVPSVTEAFGFYHADAAHWANDPKGHIVIDDGRRYLKRTAKKGATSPNPMVGAVLVKGGRIIGRGWHRRAGRPHAEIEALRDAQKRGHSPRGATLFVTLEPCCTQGRTPPCTDALIAAGIKRVVIGATDPNPRTRAKASAFCGARELMWFHGALRWPTNA